MRSKYITFHFSLLRTPKVIWLPFCQDAISHESAGKILACGDFILLVYALVFIDYVSIAWKKKKKETLDSWELKFNSHRFSVIDDWHLTFWTFQLQIIIAFQNRTYYQKQKRKRNFRMWRRYLLPASRNVDFLNCVSKKVTRLCS